MFGWEFPPHNSGGLGTACFGLTRALSNEDIHIKFVLPRKMDVDASFVNELLFADDTTKIKITPVNVMLTPYMSSTDYHYAKFLDGSPIYGQTLFEEVMRYAAVGGKIAEEGDFDIIHAHDWLAMGAGLAAKKVSGKPLIVHVHATEFDRSGDNINQTIYQLEKEGMEGADQIIAVSNFTKQIIIEKYGIPADKIEVVWNGIDAEDYPHRFDAQTAEENPIINFKNQGYKIVLFVGRLTMQKGPDYFLEAAKKVLGCTDKVMFVIAGSGDMERQIMQQAASLGISNHILFPGFLRGDELNKVYKAADLFVLSSVSEPFGITPLESVINGTPVLISKQSGVSEALPNALKVDFWDTWEMANQMYSALEHASLADCLAVNSAEDVKKLTWKSAAQKCLHIYHKLMGHS
jgi:glycogen synthase